MALGVESACINHPAIEATHRCKQCGKPVCGDCRVQAPKGNFCSENCLDTYQQFIERAEQLDRATPKPSQLWRLRRIVQRLIVFFIPLAFFAFLATYMGYDVPVIGDFIRQLIHAATK
jgi:hypothetical protein